MNTSRLAIPYILQNQSQKEVTHNEGLNILDCFIQPAIETANLSAPPDSPAEGALWIVGASPEEDWVGHENELAQFIGGGWRFHQLPAGFGGWIRETGCVARWTGSNWEFGIFRATSVVVDGDQVIGGRQPSIADASGGDTVDAEARTALNALLAACRAHGLIAE